MKWTHKILPLKSLKPQSKNPRVLTKDQKKQIEKSLHRFGVADPLIVNSDGTLIGGHQRYHILSEQGVESVDCMVASKQLTQKQVDELTIRLNKNTGAFDYDILANEYELDELLDIGFTDEDFEIHLPPDPLDDDEESEPPKDPKTKPGDLITLGDHRLLCGDSTNPDHVEKLLNGHTPILMVTDPPYGVEYDASWREKEVKSYGKKRAKGKVTNDDRIDWSQALKLFPGNIAYVWHSAFHAAEVQNNLDEIGFQIISQIIWVKQKFVISRGDYHWKHENCWYAVKKGCKHNWQGSRKQTTVWEIASLNAFGKNQEDERTPHSTQKPLECMRIPIKNNSQKGQRVYDPFCGSGTTLLACEQLERKCLAMEIDPAYCDIIIGRWQREQIQRGKNPEYIVNGKLKKEEIYEKKYGLKPVVH